MPTSNNPAAIVTEYITTYDGSDANDADNAKRRAQVLSYLQHIYEHIHNARDWEWTYTETSFNMSATNSILISTAIATFLEFGDGGGLFDSNGNPYTEVSRYVLQRYRRFGQGAANYMMFAVFDGKLQFPFTFSAITAMVAFHRKIAETLADDATAMAIPSRYIDTVVMPGLVFLAQQGKNDARGDFGAMFRDGFSQMCAIERPNKTRVQRLPLAVRGAW